MTSRIFGLITFLVFSSVCRAEVQFYTALLGGPMSFTETQGASSYSHQSQFFIGHLGVALGGGYVFTAGVLGLGLKGEVGWLGDSVDRKPNDSSSSVGYRDESQRILGGLLLSFRPGPVALDLEYYPTVVNYVGYSDKKSENPFRKNDKWNGTGFGFSLAFKFFPPMRNFVTFRKLSYNKVDMSGVEVSLPSSAYSKLEFNEIVLGFGSEF